MASEAKPPGLSMPFAADFAASPLAMTVLENNPLPHGRAKRGKIHSSHGGRKAYLNFELKDHDRQRGRRFAPSLTSKFRYAPTN